MSTKITKLENHFMTSNQTKNALDRLDRIDNACFVTYGVVSYCNIFNAFYMIPKILPAGTTLEQWQRYEDECNVHETAMRYKELYFDHVCAMLKLEIEKYPNEWKNDPMLMAKAFESHMQHEVSMSRSCDAPNKPGYYRANND